MHEFQLYPHCVDPLRASAALPPSRRARRWRLSSLLFCALSACGSADDNADVSLDAFGNADALPVRPKLPGNPPATRPDTAANTNPFVMVAQDPASTFGIDADTASYQLFVRDVNDGVVPSPERVRLEDFVNYFDYAYPAPPADAEEPPFSVALAAAQNPLRSGTTLLRVGLQGRPPPAQEKRPANLTFLVDVSGSMSGPDRLPLVQRVLRRTLTILEPTDTVSIVSYASDTRVRLAPTPVSQSKAILDAIEGLQSGGGTAGASGIQLAYEQASQAFLQGGINHVLLCTDGDFNLGPSSDRELVELITEKRKSGVTLTALGFGTGNLNDAMLEQVSNAGNGFYGFIGSSGQADSYVSERLLSTVTLIARDVKVQVEFNPELVVAYRLLGYEDRAIADRDFRNDRVDAGEIGAGHRVTALYELVLAGGSVPRVPNAPPSVDAGEVQAQAELTPAELLRVKLRYKAPDATESSPARELSASLPPDAVSSFAQADADLAWAAGVAAFAEILKESPYAQPEQLDTLDALFAAQADRDSDRAEFYRLFTAVRGRL